MKKNKIKIILFLIIIFIFLFGILKIQNSILKIFYRMDYKEYVYKYALENEIDPYLVFAIIKAESNFDNKAVSKSGAIGLMQLMENTAKEVAEDNKIENFTKEDLYDTEKNIMLGVTYYKKLLNKYNNNFTIALVAYNAGIGVVDNWIKEKIISEDGKDLENIPYKETNMYVRKIIRDYEIYKDIYSK